MIFSIPSHGHLVHLASILRQFRSNPSSCHVSTVECSDSSDSESSRHILDTRSCPYQSLTDCWDSFLSREIIVIEYSVCLQYVLRRVYLRRRKQFKPPPVNFRDRPFAGEDKSLWRLRGNYTKWVMFRLHQLPSVISLYTAYPLILDALPSSAAL